MIACNRSSFLQVQYSRCLNRDINGVYQCWNVKTFDERYNCLFEADYYNPCLHFMSSGDVEW